MLTKDGGREGFITEHAKMDSPDLGFWSDSALLSPEEVEELAAIVAWRRERKRQKSEKSRS